MSVGTGLGRLSHWPNTLAKLANTGSVQNARLSLKKKTTKIRENQIKQERSLFYWMFVVWMLCALHIFLHLEICRFSNRLYCAQKQEHVEKQKHYYCVIFYKHIDDRSGFRNPLTKHQINLISSQALTGCLTFLYECIQE